MCLSDAIFCRPLCTSSPSSPFSQYRQDHIDEVYRDQEAWTEKSIMSTAGSGFFSSDRTILEYAKCVAGGWGGRALLRGQCTLPFSITMLLSYIIPQGHLGRDPVQGAGDGSGRRVRERVAPLRKKETAMLVSNS